MVSSYQVVLTHKGIFQAKYSTLYESDITDLVKEMIADCGLKAGDSISVEETRSEE